MMMMTSSHLPSQMSGQASSSQDASCGCGCPNCQCGPNCNCCSTDCTASDTPRSLTLEDAMAEHLLDLADKAWEKLMISKMKDHLKATCGDMMDDLARAAVEANTAHWQADLAQTIAETTYRDTLKELLRRSTQGGNPAS